MDLEFDNAMAVGLILWLVAAMIIVAILKAHWLIKALIVGLLLPICVFSAKMQANR